MAHHEVRRKPRRMMRRITALALAGAVVAGGFTAASFTPGGSSLVQEAHAISAGPGMGGGFPGGTNSGYSLGAYRHSNGTLVYCLEMGVSANMGSNPSMNVASTAPSFEWNGTKIIEGTTYTRPGGSAVSGDTLRYMNYILDRWGDTSSNSQAASVQLAIWELRRSGGNSEYVRMLNDYRATYPSQAATADSYIQQARNNAQAPADQEPTQITETGPYSGTVTIPANTNFVELKNAVFADTGLSTRSWPNGLNNPATLAWEGRPPAGWTDKYEVSISGTYLVDSTPAQVRIGNPGNGNQRLVSAVGTTNEERRFTTRYVEPGTMWEPVLTSQVPNDFVQEGESFDDTITFGVAENSNPWRYRVTTGGDTQYAPITAVGTLYGPFDQNPESFASTEPPADAEVAATATVTTDTAQGPGTYEIDIDGDATASEAGFYSWVWEIRWEDQDEGVRVPGNGADPALPENYYYTDGFGTVNETQIVPNRLDISTELVDDQIVIGNEFHDQVTAESVNGDWMREDDGSFKPYTLIGTVYGSNEEPVQSANAPADAEVITTTRLVVDQPGVPTLTDPIRLPVLTEYDWLTVQFCVESGQDFVVVTCDDYGVPSETAQIVRPDVETQAQEESASYSDIHDVAFVEGPLPDLPTRVTFEGYLKVEEGQPKYDENWQPILDENGEPVLWTAEEVQALLDSGELEYCEAQPVASTDPVEVTGEGAYQSPDVYAWSSGTFYWVEELQVEDPETGEWETVVRGECGIPNETTEIEDPTVTTQAVEVGMVNGYIHDVAIVEGPMPESPTRVSFEGFLRAEAGEPKYDENWNPIYEPELEFLFDENGEPVLDEEGNPVAEPVTQPVLDEDGNPVLDENGEPVVETVPALDEDGNPIPAVWTQEEIDALLEQGELAYCEAQPVASTDPVEVNGEGEYTSPDVLAQSPGTFYWVETLEVETPGEEDEDNWREVHRGECGLPNETTEIEEPEVTTQAQEDATAGETIQDTAIVTGEIDDDERVTVEVDFEVFVQDENHEVVLEDGVDVNAVCTDETSFAVTDRVTVTTAGEYDSPAVQTQVGDGGIYYWVETLHWTNEETGEEGVFHVGECGLQNERTDVVEPVAGVGSTSGSVSPYLFIGALFVLAMMGLGVALIVRNRIAKSE